MITLPRPCGGVFLVCRLCDEYAWGRLLYSHWSQTQEGIPMASAETRLRVRKDDGVIHIEFVDRNILDEANIQQIGDEVSALIEAEDKPRLVISFSNVDHLSSAALGTLITIHNKMKAKQGRLRLANIDPQIYEVFVITKLNKLFEIHESSEQAILSLQ